VLPLAKNANATLDHVEISPPKSKHFGAPQSCPFHQHNGRPLMPARGDPDLLQLLDTRTVNVWTQDPHLNR
jgi:hypothetical protein